MRRPGQSSVSLALLLVAAVSHTQQPVSEDPRVVEVVRKARALEAEIDLLLATLPPELESVARALLAAQRQRGSVDGETVTVEPVSVTPATPAPAVPVSAVPVSGRELDAPTVRTVVACSGLRLLDTDGDGALTGADRYWRHLYLQLDPDSLVSVFDAGVRRIALDLSSFTTADGGAGYLEVSEVVRLDVVIKRRRGTQLGVLVVDVDRLARSDGPRISSQSAERLEGLQPLRLGQLIELGGRRETFSCQ